MGVLVGSLLRELLSFVFIEMIFYTLQFLGSAIRCFVCNSNVDIRCALPYPPSEFTIDCDTLDANRQFTFCRKTSQIVSKTINERNLQTFTSDFQCLFSEEKSNHIQKCNLATF